MSDDAEECTGAGNCHGCLKWCPTCGDVAHVCDMRLRGERCDQHPVPPRWPTLRAARREAERKLAMASQLGQDGRADLQTVIDAENARRAYDDQLSADEERIMSGNTRGVKS